MSEGNLYDLDVYKLARKLSKIAWEIYSEMDWHTKKIIGDQFIESVDSIGANVSEGYGRYHFSDKIRFLFISRGSHHESILHWADLMHERKIINEERHKQLKDVSDEFITKLNGYISYLNNSKNKT
jgi:four helix bundle protein